MRLKLFYVSLLVLAGWPLSLQANWNTTQFEVFFGEPWYVSQPDFTTIGRFLEDEYDWSLDEEQSRPSYISQATVTEIERYLHETAEWLKAAGFPGPQLEPLVKRADGQWAYRIYLYDGELGAPARYGNGCLKGVVRRLIEVDVETNAGKDKVINGRGQITEKGYQDLAHELFHAVQAAYPIFADHCDLGDWIVEGSAQAVGVDAALKLRKINPRNKSTWGTRRYYEPLRVQDDPPCPATGSCERRNDGYWTASLWRYLGEMERQAGQYPPAKYTEPDYEILHRIFGRSLSGSPSEGSELAWLDDSLADSTVGFGKSLDRVFATFVTAFGSYPDTRQAQTAAPNLAKRTQWQKMLFDGCQEVAISPDESPSTVTVTLKTVSAACLKLQATAGGVKAVSVTAHHDTGGAYADLWVGTQQGLAVGKPLQVRIMENEFAEWRFRVDFLPGEDTLMMISNVAQDAEDTAEQTVELRLTATSFTSNLGSP